MGVAIHQGICKACVYCYKVVKDRSDKRVTCGNVDSKMFDKVYENPENRGCLHCFMQKPAAR